MNYQPVFGTELPYQRDCEERYEIIRELAKRFNRRFSVLDVGANFGWFDFKLMSEFDCTCVLIDNKPVRPLIEEFGDDRAYHLDRHLTGRELYKLSKSENFDIVLGLSVLHHIHDFKMAYDGLRNLGKHVYIEIPALEPRAANPARHEELSELLDGENEIATVKSHLGGVRPIYLIEGEPRIEEQSLDAKYRKAPNYATYNITSDFDKCEIEIDRSANPTLPCPVERRDFYPGMNAHNFMLLGGGTPNKAELTQRMDGIEHPDHNPWNFVLGHGVIPIDTINKWQRQ